MTFRRVVIWSLSILLLLVVGSLLLGMFLGQPILLSFVETGSMEPTIKAGDGFVAIPSAIAGDIGQGDVVIFEATDGSLTTHRVVGETDRGYITQGDANPFTDQDAGEPVVQDAQIVAKAGTLGGSIITIPHLGTAVNGMQDSVSWVQRTLFMTFGIGWFLGAEGLLLLIFLLTVIAYAIDVLVSDPRSSKRTRTTTRSSGMSVRVILIGFALIVMIAATAAMVVPADNHEFGIVSAEFESERPNVIQAGHSDDIQMPVSNTAGWIPVHSYLEPASGGVDVDPRYVYVDARGEEEVTLTFTAPDETGYYPMYVTEHRYLAILPKSVTDTLYGAHEWLPLIVINLILGGGVYGAGRLIVGDPSKRLRSRTKRKRRTGSTWLIRILP